MRYRTLPGTIWSGHITEDACFPIGSVHWSYNSLLGEACVYDNEAQVAHCLTSFGMLDETSSKGQEKVEG
jgi:hypothetical protein